MDVYLVQPRGFCAGVRRALDIVEETLQKYGAPIYVRHEIVHNKHIIENLKRKDVIFINELDEIKDTSRPVIFSAHGVSDKVRIQAEQMNLTVIDATCPLVGAVHQKIKQLEKDNAEIIIIGKASHPEIIGTVGQLNDCEKAHIVSTMEDVEKLPVGQMEKVGVVTQTTLSVEETKEIMEALRHKFPYLQNTKTANICFATTNRQKAVKELVAKVKNIVVIGSKNSSNSQHLKEAALGYGAQQAWLIDDVSELNWQAVDACPNIGISAGASAPEYLVEEVLSAFKQRYDNVNIHDVIVEKENITFK